MNDHQPLFHCSEFRFFGQLNDFLPAGQRHQTRCYRFTRCPALRDAIQAQGVPHTEVKLILVDGISRHFDQPLLGGERVSVFPHFLAPAFRGADQLGAPLPSLPRFILDVHLGTLSRHLRLLGFDSCYGNDFEDNYIIDRALAEQRMILTRDLGILKQRRVKHGYFVRATDPDLQIEEVLRIFDLEHRCQPLSRCINCNGLLQRVAKETVADRLPPGTKRSYQHFYQCQSCQQLYWRGAHFSGLVEKLARCGLEIPQ